MNKKIRVTIAVLIIVFLLISVYAVFFTNRDGGQEMVPVPDNGIYIGEVNDTIDGGQNMPEDFISYQDVEFIDEAQVFIEIADQDGPNAVLISSNIFSLENTLDPSYNCATDRLPIDVINTSKEYLSVGIYSKQTGEIIYRIANITPDRLYGTQNLPIDNQAPCSNYGSEYEIVAALHKVKNKTDFQKQDLLNSDYSGVFAFRLD